MRGIGILLNVHMRDAYSPIDYRKTFMIKAIEPQHSRQKVYKNQEADVVWVVRRFRKLIEANPDIGISFLCNEIHHIYEVTLPVWTLYRAKGIVLEKTDVVNCKSYSMFHIYGSIVRQ
ncbi:hypothetical protein ACOSQ3_002209 [Xanthoceras sorbifolium]